jgi:glycosyltransferase involved in cell wall biosynthesis
MNELTTLNPNYSTTRRVYRTDADVIADELKAAHKPEYKFETLVFLPEGEGREGEGGVRSQGYFKHGKDDKPLITVVTVVFNGEQFLEETILTVINQTYDNVEYIIIDGGSTDGTLDIIRKYEHAIDYWVSEKDKGISDAFNKAVKLATGVYINFQGDGDGFYTPDALEKVFHDISPNDDIFVSARILRVNEDNSEIYTSSHSESFNPKSLLFRMSMPHQGLFTHIEYFKNYGLFDLNNTFCMDYEHLLRAYHNFPKVVTKDVVVAKWRADGLGNGRTQEIFKEYDKIKRDNKVADHFVIDCIKYWTVFKYYVKKIIRRD